MKHVPFLKLSLILTALLLIFTGCVSARTPSASCTVIFEDNPALFFPDQVYEVRQLEDLAISIGVPHGERIASVNYEDYTLSAKTGESLSYDYYTLTLHQIRYSAVIRLTTATAYTTVYHPGEGQGEEITVLEESPHLYFNTLPFREQFVREGYLPAGWNTEADGSGIHIGFGSRIDHRNVQQLDLYMEWLPCTEQECFTYTLSGEEATITGYLEPENAKIQDTTIIQDTASSRDAANSQDTASSHGTEAERIPQPKAIVIPSVIEGCPVTAISENAFQDVDADLIALPWTLKTISPGAFGNITAADFYFFDNVESFPEEAFESYAISRLHINAVLDPVYSGSYFDTLSDKLDYLSSLQDQTKIVLFCGSSARFGYNSPMLEAAFPDYKVVNMGVYAYSNMLPQSKMILPFMREGDILLSSPELDTIETQFCGETALDKETFCMAESNYDMLTLLDCTEFTHVFQAFHQYNAARSKMTARSYLDSPAYYDEDGKEQNTLTYNHCGDYILYRENNSDRKSFGIKRAFYNADYIRDQDLNGLNAVYDAFARQGVTVCFTYSPRSSISISEDSTPESILLLDEMLRDNLHAHMISSITSSLMDPLYFYGTDNHLSTEGARLHTDQIIEDLRDVLEHME